MTKTQRLEARIRRASERAREMAGTFRNAGEAALSAGVLGYVHGKNIAGEDFKVFGVPVDMATALAFGGLGLFELGGRQYSDDLVAVGTGALCYYTGRMGKTMGEESLEADRKVAGARRQQLPAGRVRFGAGAARNPYNVAA